MVISGWSAVPIAVATAEGVLLTPHRYFSLALVAVVTGLLAGVSSAAPLSADSIGVRAHDAAKKVTGLSAKPRALLRQRLAREVRRNPAVVTKRSFIREAALAEFRLPFSVRLRRSDGSGGYEASDDQLEIAWDDSAIQWPLDG